MIIVAMYGLVVASVILSGGRLGRLATIRIRHAWSIFVALGIQIVIVNVVEHHISPLVGALTHLASYAVALAFVWWNRHMPGIGVTVLGGLANLAAIAANGGVMPALPSALQAAGRLATEDTFQNSAASTGSPLWFLGDVFAWPAPLPLANVFSIGDVILLAGVAITMHSACGSRLARRLGPATSLRHTT